MTDIVSGGDTAKEVLTAIAKATGNMPSLKKADHNEHGGYNFVSVDAYYEKVTFIALQEGLIWKGRETGCEIVDAGTNNRGQPTKALMSTYMYDMMHAPSGTIWNGFSCITIIHPLQGAQTAGSSLSYADKLFMRSTFKICSGETDADSTDNKAFEPAEPPPARRFDMGIPGTIGPTFPILTGHNSVMADDRPGVMLSTATDSVDGLHDDMMHDADEVYRLATGFIDLAKTVPDLEKYWLDNEPVYKDKIKQVNPTLYKELVAVFKAKKGELNG